jgi:hypothetical protein
MADCDTKRQLVFAGPPLSTLKGVPESTVRAARDALFARLCDDGIVQHTSPELLPLVPPVKSDKRSLVLYNVFRTVAATLALIEREKMRAKYEADSSKHEFLPAFDDREIRNAMKLIRDARPKIVKAVELVVSQSEKHEQYASKHWRILHDEYEKERAVARTVLSVLDQWEARVASVNGARALRNGAEWSRFFAEAASELVAVKFTYLEAGRVLGDRRRSGRQVAERVRVAVRRYRAGKRS